MQHTPTDIDLKYFNASDLKLDASKNKENSYIIIFEPDPDKCAPNDAINDNINEKIRKFNNSIINIANSIRSLTQFYEILKQPADTYDRELITGLYRQECKTLYMSIFVYYEKLKSFIRYFFFLSRNNTQSIEHLLSKLERYNSIDGVNDLVRKFREVNNYEKFKIILRIRNDEIHNESEIDHYIYKFEDNPFRIEVVDYQISNSDLYEDAKYGLCQLKLLRDSLQHIVDSYERNDIYKIKTTPNAI